MSNIIDLLGAKTGFAEKAVPVFADYFGVKQADIKRIIYAKSAESFSIFISSLFITIKQPSDILAPILKSKELAGTIFNIDDEERTITIKDFNVFLDNSLQGSNVSVLFSENASTDHSKLQLTTGAINFWMECECLTIGIIETSNFELGRGFKFEGISRSKYRNFYLDNNTNLSIGMYDHTVRSFFVTKTTFKHNDYFNITLGSGTVVLSVDPMSLSSMVDTDTIPFMEDGSLRVINCHSENELEQVCDALTKVFNATENGSDNSLHINLPPASLDSSFIHIAKAWRSISDDGKSGRRSKYFKPSKQFGLRVKMPNAELPDYIQNTFNDILSDPKYFDLSMTALRIVFVKAIAKHIDFSNQDHGNTVRSLFGNRKAQ